VERRCPRRWSLAAGGGLLGLAVLASGIGLSPAPARGDDIVIRITVPGLKAAEKDVPAKAVIEKDVLIKKAGAGRVHLERAPGDVKDVKKVIVIDGPDGKVRKIELPGDVLKKDPAADVLRWRLGQLAGPQDFVVRGKRDLDELHKALEKLDKVLGKEEAERVRKDITKALGKLRNLQAPQVDLLEAVPQISRLVELKHLGRSGSGRLGVHVERPGAALADQLNLPKGKGLVVGEVKAGSAADKAGLKANDVLVEVNGRPVPSDPAAFVRLLDEVKAGTPVDVVVLRKGKQETIKGLTLP
jgi:membrane-associated protease RseP (regulator of RpoE activity)